jgi:hypothetical protein
VFVSKGWRLARQFSPDEKVCQIAMFRRRRREWQTKQEQTKRSRAEPVVCAEKGLIDVRRPQHRNPGSWKNDKGEYETRTEWHRVFSWRNLSKFAKTIQKGQLVTLEGTVRRSSVAGDSGRCHGQAFRALRMLISQLKHELEELANFIGEADGSMERASRENESCRRLLSVPGIGPVTATALIAAIGNGAAFRKGREFSAWVGMVRRESPTGGKQRLTCIAANRPRPITMWRQPRSTLHTELTPCQWSPRGIARIL